MRILQPAEHARNVRTVAARHQNRITARTRRSQGITQLPLQRLELGVGLAELRQQEIRCLTDQVPEADEHRF